MKILSFAILLIPTIAAAQFSGYLSSTYGYHENPLYNYAQTSDRVSQSYVELRHTSDFGNSSLELGYTGGLVLFSEFSERNYYEHSLAGRWNLITREPDEDVQEADSSGTYLASELKFTARHDKSLYEVYDNSSGALNVSYRAMTGGALFTRLTNKAEYRSYKLVSELSNFTDLLTASLGSRSRDKLYFEVLVNAGMKHYTTTLNDTSIYETITAIPGGTGTGTGHGNGHGNGKSGTGSSTAPGFIKKQHLYATPEASTSWQLLAGATIGKEWEKCSALVGIVYRYNPTTAVRYVAQYVNTSTLSEDIYNDHFSYEGPEAGFRFTQSFPYRISANLQLQWASRTYSAPALSLDGAQVANNRNDTLTALELMLSKAFTIAEGVDLDLNLTGSAMKNRSNDEYNNFSAGAVAVGIGVGF